MPTALAISPHLDDAVFSAGGLLARLSGAGWRVIVATVFTASVPDPQGFALACQLDKGLGADIDYMALRRDEDAAACACLGAEPLWLPFAEAPHRGYDSAAALFDGLQPQDGIVVRLSAALRDLVESRRPDMILAPQAVGAHVDHVAVVLAVIDCCKSVRWWTDYPYGARPSVRPSPLETRFSHFGGEKIGLAPEELQAKLDAVTAYGSQLGFQFGGIEAARAQIAQTGRVESYLVGAA